MATPNPFAALFACCHFHVAQLEPNVSSKEPASLLLAPNPKTDVGYDCISYDRSRDYGTSKIVFAGSEINVPAPLETALRALRKPDKARFVWADLLLGQTQEQRSELAKLGKEVLQNATSTIAWLGPEDAFTAEAFQNIKTLAIWWHQAKLHSNFPEVAADATSEQMLKSWQYIHTQDITRLQPDNEFLWATMLGVFVSPYFDSVQTVPDIVLSSNTLITSGTSAVAWEDILAATNSLLVVMGQMLKRVPDEELVNAVSRLHQIEIARRRYRDGETLELLPMIQTARNARSVDAREYVFAMLPICGPSLRQQSLSKAVPLPTADYSKSVESIFVETAKYVIEDRSDLLLWWSERPPHARRLREMPSWVPDYTTSLPEEKDGGGPIRLSPGGKPSLRDWSESVKPQRRIIVEENKLCLQAHRLDRITVISQMFTIKNYIEVAFDMFKRCPVQAYTNKEEVMDIFWRTCLLNVGGPTDTFREQASPAKETIWPSFMSMLAKAQILDRLGATMEQLNTDKEVQERAKTDQWCQEQGTLIVPDQTFEQMFLKAALGRRMFYTERGRMGMTAFEQLPVLDGAEGEKQARMAELFNRPEFRDQDAADGAILPSPFAAGPMQDAFLSFMRQRDPVASAEFEKTMKLKDFARGAKVGDYIIAAVGGFYPYVVRQAGEQEPHLSQASIGGKEFRFIGDCYLHGVMHGEPFSNRDWLGRHSWMTDVKVENIKII